MKRFAFIALLCLLPALLLAAPGRARVDRSDSANSLETATYDTFKQWLYIQVEQGLLTEEQVGQILTEVGQLATEIEAVRAENPNGPEMKIEAMLAAYGLPATQIPVLAQHAVEWLDEAATVSSGTGRVRPTERQTEEN